MAEGKSKVAHHGFTHSHHEHHADGSITVHHVHHEGPHKDIKHAVANLDGAHDSMQENLGQANPGEMQADQGMHGVPAPMAQVAGLPMQGA